MTYSLRNGRSQDRGMPGSRACPKVSPSRFDFPKYGKRPQMPFGLPINGKGGDLNQAPHPIQTLNPHITMGGSMLGQRDHERERLRRKRLAGLIFRLVECGPFFDRHLSCFLETVTKNLLRRLVVVNEVSLWVHKEDRHD